MRLDFSAISDVGRVRKDNQDSGYVGPHLVAVCDGVGGAARGDIASSTAIAQLRKLDENPPGPDTPEKDLLGQVSGALHRAHARIAELVDENPVAQRHQHHRHHRALRRASASAWATWATAAPTCSATARSAS